MRFRDTHRRDRRPAPTRGGMRVLLGTACIATLCACADTEAPWAVTMLEAPAGPNAAQAHLAAATQGPVLLSWQEPVEGGGTALRLARLEDERWSQPTQIAAGSNWFVNWADFPSVVPLRTAVVAHWLVLKPDQRYAYDIAYALSKDGGASWSEPLVLNSDDGIAEHGFVSFFDWGQDIGAVWLDGRRVAALSIDELFELEEPVGMTLRFAKFEDDGTVVDRGELDELVCDCCQTDAVTTAEGPVIVYRDRTTDEVRDIVVRHALGARSADAAAQAAWSEPVVLGPDGWVIDGCPVNGPALAASGRHVVAAWFTAAEQRPRIRFARSLDGGMSFGPAVTVAESGALGQVDIVVTPDGTAWLSAWHKAVQGMELRVHRIAPDSAAIESRVVATQDSSLPTDVPQLALDGNRLVFAWSRLGSRESPGRLFTATAPLW